MYSSPRDFLGHATYVTHTGQQAPEHRLAIGKTHTSEVSETGAAGDGIG